MNYRIWTRIAAAGGIFFVVLSVLGNDVLGHGDLVESARWGVLGVGLHLYLRRSSRFGWLGAVGCYTLIVGCVLSTIVYLGLVPSEGAVAEEQSP